MIFCWEAVFFCCKLRSHLPVASHAGCRLFVYSPYPSKDEHTTGFWNEPLRIDGRDILLSGSMPENIRGLLLQFHIHRNRVALVRADQRMLLPIWILTFDMSDFCVRTEEKCIFSSPGGTALSTKAKNWKPLPCHSSLL